jgi:hypothetical protein
MRHDADFKIIRMIPHPRTTTANGQTVSAATYGTTGSTKGTVDLRGWDRAQIIIEKQAGTAQKLSKVYLGTQSAATTLWASTTPLPGFTSGIVLSSVTTSAAQWLVNINLAELSNRKAFLNCKVTTSTTSGNVDVSVLLMRGKQFPPATTGFTSVQQV